MRFSGIRPSARAWAVTLRIALGIALIATACSRPETGAEAANGQLFHPDGWTGVSELPDDSLYDPVRAGETLPRGFRQVLRRDGIPPVYLPNFVTADQTDWPDNELVIGVELDGEARAYPISFLNRREIVVDMHRGIPTFVTW